MWISYDGGTKWWKGANLPISQFYHVSVDDKDPYQVYGGLQDNSSWVGDSAYPGGITNSRWENLYGGDGFWSFADPKDPNFVYTEAQGGSIGRVNPLDARGAQHPAQSYADVIEEDAVNPKLLFLGTEFGLWISVDAGASWAAFMSGWRSTP